MAVSPIFQKDLFIIASMQLFKGKKYSVKLFFLTVCHKKMWSVWKSFLDEVFYAFHPTLSCLVD
jgi:glucose dehydrogenase